MLAAWSETHANSAEGRGDSSPAQATPTRTDARLSAALRALAVTAGEAPRNAAEACWAQHVAAMAAPSPLIGRAVEGSTVEQPRHNAAALLAARLEARALLAAAEARRGRASEPPIGRTMQSRPLSPPWTEPAAERPPWRDMFSPKPARRLAMDARLLSKAPVWQEQ